jgi:hypothetical protein
MDTSRSTNAGWTNSEDNFNVQSNKRTKYRTFTVKIEGPATPQEDGVTSMA